MAKIDLNTVSSGYLSQAALNANFTAIENEFQNKVLYRDNPSGEPNSMQSNLDMNGYYVLNAGNTSLADADNIAYTPNGTGAETRTISEKLNDVVSVKDFGAVGDGVTDDTVAIQAAIAASRSVYLPAGSYRTTSTITLSSIGQSLIGAGGGGNSKTGGSSGVVPTGINRSATQIVADFNGGPVIRISNQGCTVSDMTIARSTSAFAAAFNLNDQGIRIAANDAAGYQTARDTRLDRLRVMNQPGDGVLFVCDAVSSVVSQVEVNCVKGCGFMVAGGSYLSYSNRTQPGIITFIACVAAWTGAHGCRFGGGEVDNTDHPYRMQLLNVECFYNCIITANCISSPAVANLYMSADSSTIINSAWDGLVEFPTSSPNHAAAVFRGNNIRFLNSRFIQCTAPAAYITGPHSGGGGYSRGIRIEDLYVVNTTGGAGYFNPVVNVSSLVRDVTVTCNQPDSTSAAAITKLTSRTIDTLWQERFNGVANQELRTQVSSGALNSGSVAPNMITLADDKAGYWEWDGVTRGILLLCGNASGAQSTIFAFRVGTSVYTSSMGAGANVNFTTGALTGTTGVDTKLTLSPDTTTNRLYIENRLGAQYSWTPTFLSLTSNSPAIGILSDFVNLA